MPAAPSQGSTIRAGRMPSQAPLPMAEGAPAHPLRVSEAPPRGARIALLAGLALLTGAAIWAMARALLPLQGAADVAVLGLFALVAGWTAAAAATALLGLVAPASRGAAPPPGWRPTARTAVLVLTCGEAPMPVVRRVRALRDGLAAAGLLGRVEIFVLSDTRGAAAQAEARAFAAFDGLPGLWWRQRKGTGGRKPGNIADWVEGWGGAHDLMVVLDADSRMTGARLRAMIHRMEASPGTGLLQAGMQLVPARSRFGALQRLSGRLCGPGFGRGLAAWTGAEGNYWGHNAILRVDAFAAAARLPRLPGRAPFGGEILSHDFVEAALLRRAGWAVEIAPDTRGSFEDGPQRLSEFHRRDRRWCQGNLQHARLLAMPGLHPASRLHLASGIFSYLAAPLWLALVLTVALGQLGLESAAPLAAGLGLLAVPKLAGLALWLRRARSRARRRVVLRAGAAELALSTLVAPLLLLRQSLAVASVLAGRDCGWTPAGGVQAAAARPGRIEAASGLVLTALAAPLAGGAGALLLAPVLLPLLAAPWLVPWLEAPLRRRNARGLAFDRRTQGAAAAPNRAAA